MSGSAECTKQVSFFKSQAPSPIFSNLVIKKEIIICNLEMIVYPK